uniref:Integrase catalytic domain-containing protein n=1 Tax=Fagus sylvatica TaxID=28930 RepID=A0A2N9H5S1_FAGSY
MSDFDVLGTVGKLALPTFCKVPDLRKSELGLVRYGPANRGHRGVFGPFEGSFPIGIPASPDKFLAIREFHVVHECVFFPMCPGSQINLLRVRKTLCASVATSVGKFRNFQQNLILSACFHARGRRSSRCRISTILVSSESLRYLLFNVLATTLSFLVRFRPVKYGIEALDILYTLVKGWSVRSSFWSGQWSGQTLVKLGQPWSNLVEVKLSKLLVPETSRSNRSNLGQTSVNPSQTWSNLGKCIWDAASPVVRIRLPSLLHDATQYVKTCDKCQRFANVPRVPPEEITPITSPWPFAQWGLDIMGPFSVGTKQAKFLVVAIDYFTKWVEAEPLATITEKNVKSFVWKAVICRFGIPRVLISDNGKQFDNGPFREMCSQLNIKNHYSSPRHPQANGQVEVTNRTLLKQIKTRLEGAKGMWVEELPSVLWAYRTTVRTPTKETPFKLTFGTEAVIPVEIGLTTFRTTFHKEEENEGQLRLNLDLLDETREKAAQRIALYQGRMARYYNTKVKLRRFEVSDWVLRKVTQATKDPSQGKLGPNWEGPYKVTQYYRRGTYHLEDRHGKKLPHPWNAEHLKKYYP